LTDGVEKLMMREFLEQDMTEDQVRGPSRLPRSQWQEEDRRGRGGGGAEEETRDDSRVLCKSEKSEEREGRPVATAESGVRPQVTKLKALRAAGIIFSVSNCDRSRTEKGRGEGHTIALWEGGREGSGPL
jgi:hypothetical protein